jgi:hypothetical protein
MARPQVANGEGLQICRVAVNTLSSRRQPARGGHPTWVLGGGLTTPYHEKHIMLGIVTQGLGLVLTGFIWFRIGTNDGLL